MGQLADRLNTIRIQADTANGAITGELSHRTRVRVAFRPGVYDRCDPGELERQVENLARRLRANRMREYYAALSEALGETVTGEAKPISQRDVDFYRARDEMLVEGRSRDGRVTVALRGVRDFRVRLEPGTLQAHTEHQFADAVEEAADELLHSQREQIRELKLTIYDGR